MRLIRTALGVTSVMLFGNLAFAQFIETPTPPPPSLKELEVPEVVETVSGLPLIDQSAEGAGGFIKNNFAAIALGKALFWDTQVGSNGVACATCHYHAGADAREKNQLSPGGKGGDMIFDPLASGGTAPNQSFETADFPFHQFLDPDDRDSGVIFTTDDTSSSAGTYAQTFVDVVPGNPVDDCTNDASIFEVGGVLTRQVEPRNTPTVINAVFNFRQFWDGRANNIFNGVDAFGLRNAAARVLEVQGSSVEQIQVAFENSSLASQAVTPITSNLEMSCQGRTTQKIGKKLLSLTPLGQQLVHSSDSRLGWVSNAPGNGISQTYQGLIEQAFATRLWNSDKLFDANLNEVGNGTPANTDEYTLTEANFGLFFGLAVQAYQATLISDDTPYDQFQEGNTSALTQQQQDGLDLFFTNDVGERGNCSTCHQGPTFTTAAFPFSEPDSGEFPEKEQLVERMRMGDGETIAENLFAYAVRGEGSFAGGDLSGVAGAWVLPSPYAAPVGGQFEYGACVREVKSFQLGLDGDPTTRDATFMADCQENSCHPTQDDMAVITIVDGGPGTDTVTVDDDGVITSGPLSSGDFVVEMAALYDTGFYNIGVRPTADDPGIGATDPFGYPLSFTEQWRDGLTGTPSIDAIEGKLTPARFDVPFSYFADGEYFPAGLDGPEWVVGTFVPFPQFVGLAAGKGREAVPKNDPANIDAINEMPLAIDGAFKTAGLRNVELTAPYFHNGGQLTLKQVMQFYNRGGDFAMENLGDLSPNIHPLTLDDTQLDSLVAFLEGLTDERVRCESAPFDHPSILLPEGHTGNSSSVVDDGGGLAVDDGELIAAVGAAGRASCPPGDADFLEE
jgi:cytochrome c peroxidase